jgi:hypothetical protein
MRLWECILILLLLLVLLRLRDTFASDRDCKPRLISFIEKCDSTGCRVQMPDGTYGHGKLPLEWAKVSEVCQ